MKLFNVLAAGLLAAGTVACGGSATATTTGPKIAIDLSEFKYSTPTIEIPAGEKVTLELKNKGAVEHDLTIDKLGLKVIVKPGQSATRTIGPLTAGTEHDVHCSVAGHKESGMVGRLVVK